MLPTLLPYVIFLPWTVFHSESRLVVLDILLIAPGGVSRDSSAAVLSVLTPAVYWDKLMLRQEMLYTGVLPLAGMALPFSTSSLGTYWQV